EARAHRAPDTLSIPSWKKLVIKSKMPKRIEGLNVLARNLWWSWNYQAMELFEAVDDELWEKVGKNPVQL
ncbi:MAG TPA: hypothetical protein DDW62_09185, partial [Marinilabiliaceae bacterium]|nr:hypothetical protein [Marinilabiliaceae bacterium]